MIRRCARSRRGASRRSRGRDGRRKDGRRGGDLLLGPRDPLCFPGDILTNAARASGIPGLLLRLTGLNGDLKVPRLIKLIGTRDKRALREQLLRLADTPALQRVFTCHGPVVAVDPAGALRRAAQAV